MFESLYWKEELSRIEKSIRPVAKPRRWSERAVSTIERDVMIGFFIVRRLIELNKVSSHIAKLELGVFRSPAVRAVTKLNRFSFERNYDWQAEQPEQRPVKYICNQCIHSYVSAVLRASDRNWSDLLVVSDYGRAKTIWRVPFSAIVQLFSATAKDWPSEMHMVFDTDLDDFIVTTD